MTACGGEAAPGDIASLLTRCGPAGASGVYPLVPSSRQGEGRGAPQEKEGHCSAIGDRRLEAWSAASTSGPTHAHMITTQQEYRQNGFRIAVSYPVEDTATFGLDAGLLGYSFTVVKRLIFQVCVCVCVSRFF